jgi:hypothetical protein
VCPINEPIKRLRRLTHRAAARRTAGAAVPAALITACGTTGGAPETTSDTDLFEAGNCFGLNNQISYFAERSSQSGDDIWLPNRFTFANSFDFVPAARDAREIAYAYAAFDPSTRKLTIRFLSSDGRLIQESFVSAVELHGCTDSETEIYFDRSLSGDGARVRDRIKVTMSRMNSSVRIRTETDRTAYFRIFSWKRFRTYDAEFLLHK